MTEAMLGYMLKGTPDTASSRPVIIFLHNRNNCMQRLAPLADAVDAEHYVYAFLNGPFAGEGAGESDADRIRAWRAPDESREISPSSRAWRLIDASIESVRSSVGAQRPVIIGGYSEGGAFALRFALEQPERFAGVIAISAAGMVPIPSEPQATPPEKRPRVFLAHGSEDRILPIEVARAWADRLQHHGFACAWHKYPIGHDLSLAEMRDLRRWLHAYWPPNAEPAARARRGAEPRVTG